MAAKDFENSMESFKKSLNVEMIFIAAKKSKINEDDLKLLKEDVVEKLRSVSRFEEAGDLIEPEQNFDLIVDCYLKANNYQKAIKVCLELNREEAVQTQVKHSLIISFELKAN